MSARVMKIPVARIVNAVTPYSCTIKLQYILLGDY